MNDNDYYKIIENSQSTKSQDLPNDYIEYHGDLIKKNFEFQIDKSIKKRNPVILTKPNDLLPKYDNNQEVNTSKSLESIQKVNSKNYNFIIIAMLSMMIILNSLTLDSSIIKDYIHIIKNYNVSTIFEKSTFKHSAQNILYYFENIEGVLHTTKPLRSNSFELSPNNEYSSSTYHIEYSPRAEGSEKVYCDIFQSVDENLLEVSDTLSFMVITSDFQINEKIVKNILSYSINDLDKSHLDFIDSNFQTSSLENTYNNTILNIHDNSSLKIENKIDDNNLACTHIVYENSTSKSLLNSNSNQNIDYMALFNDNTISLTDVFKLAYEKSQSNAKNVIYENSCNDDISSTPMKLINKDLESIISVLGEDYNRFSNDIDVNVSFNNNVSYVKSDIILKGTSLDEYIKISYMCQFMGDFNYLEVKLTVPSLDTQLSNALGNHLKYYDFTVQTEPNNYDCTYIYNIYGGMLA